MSVERTTIAPGLEVSRIWKGGWHLSGGHGAIDSGAAIVTVRLPRDVGARVMVEDGPHFIDTTGLTLDGDFYTNAAYGVSGVTMQVDVKAGIGQVNLDVEKEAAALETTSAKEK